MNKIGIAPAVIAIFLGLGVLPFQTVLWGATVNGAVEGEAHRILQTAVKTERGITWMHAAEALIACGKGDEVRRVLSLVPAAQLREPDSRIAILRVQAQCAVAAKDRLKAMERLEELFLDPAASDRTNAIESLCKLRDPWTERLVAAARKLSATQDEPETIFPLWAQALAGDESALARIVHTLGSNDPLSRLRAAYVLGWMDVTDHGALALLANAANHEEDREDAAAYVVGAAYLLNADPTRMGNWESRLRGILEVGKPFCRTEACRCLARHAGIKALDWFAPLLHSPDLETRIGAAAAICRVCASPADLDGVEATVERTELISSSYRYCWFPTLHQFSSGELIATMRMAPDEIDPESDFSAYCVSVDGGLNWSRRYTLGDGGMIDGAYTAAPRPDGTILQLDSMLGEPSPVGQFEQFHATLTVFSRGGREIRQVRDAIVHFSEPVGMLDIVSYGSDRHAGKLSKQPCAWPWGYILDDPTNGSLIATAYIYKNAENPFSKIVMLRSYDNGKSWTQYSTVVDARGPDGKRWRWMGAEGPNENGIVRLADDRLYMIFRTGGSDYVLGQTWSSDDGLTWSIPEPMPFHGVAPRLRLLSNGVLAFATGRPGPITMVFSVDGTGRSWSRPTEIFAGMSTRYSDFVEVAPGKILIVYDSVPYGWEPIPVKDSAHTNRIYAKFVSVRRN